MDGEGRRFGLEHDWESRGRYGRPLAHVCLDDGTFLNAEIIQRRYGFAYARSPIKYLEKSRILKREARGAGTRLWGPERWGGKTQDVGGPISLRGRAGEVSAVNDRGTPEAG